MNNEGGFVKLNRGTDTLDLLKHHKEWVLLSVIALRARRTESRIAGLSVGQALIGDYKALGMTQQGYRTAKKNLEKWGFVTFKPTNKGTVATLCDTGIYDINAEQPNEQPNIRVTGSQQAGNEQITTNKKERTKERKNERSKKASKSIEYPPEFEEFWDLYPKKENKREAYESWQALVNDELRQKALVGAAAYANQCVKDERESKFIANGKTWLNNHRWESQYGATPQSSPVTDPVILEWAREWLTFQSERNPLTHSDIHSFFASAREALGSDAEVQIRAATKDVLEDKHAEV